MWNRMVPAPEDECVSYLDSYLRFKITMHFDFKMHDSDEEEEERSQFGVSTHSASLKPEDYDKRTFCLVHDAFFATQMFLKWVIR